MNKFLFKENLRSMSLFIKNYLLIVIAFAFFSIVSFSFLIDKIIFSAIVVKASYIYLINIVLGIAVIIKEFPIFHIKPPVIYTCLYTNNMRKIIYNKYIFIFIKAIITSAIICIVLSSSIVIGNIGIIEFSKIFFLNLLIFILSWLNYNKSKNIGVIFAIYLIVSLSLFHRSIITLIIDFLLLSISIKWFLGVDINWGKFLEHSSYIYRSSTVAFKNDMAEMLSFAYENKKTVEHRINLSSFKVKGSNVVAAKGLIELLRKPKVFYLTNAILIIVSFLLYKNNLFISLMLQASFISNIVEQSTENLLSIINKQRYGLILPFSDREIWYVSSCIPTAIVGIYIIALSLIIGHSILTGIFTTIIFTIIILVVNKLYIRFTKYGKFIRVLAMLLYILNLIIFYY